MKQIIFKNLYKGFPKIGLLTVVLNLLFISYSQAQPGMLDSSFGINGKAAVSGFEYGSVTLIQPDGKIIAVGGISERFIMLSRFNNDGSIDDTFGISGTVKTSLHDSHNFNILEAKCAALQSDGKIIVGGTGYYAGAFGDEQYNFLVLRYNIDGSLDESFGDRGAVISDFESHEDYVRNLVIQPDGKILVGGESWVDVIIARYNNNGSLDTGFGNGQGWVRESFVGVAGCRGLALSTDGKIVLLAGEQDTYSYLLRYTTIGIRDSSFGVNGKIVTNPNDHEELYDIAIQTDGKIVAAGRSLKPELDKTVGLLFRYNQNGTYDTSFGQGGKVITLLDSGGAFIGQVLIQDDKQIITYGSYYKTGTSIGFGLIIKYNKDGTSNGHFGVNGILFTANNFTVNAKLQQDQKIVVLESKDHAYSLNRYNGEHETNPEFAKIKKWLHKHGFTWDDFPHLAPGGSIHVERSNNGNIFNTIASIAGHNNNQPYSFEDPAPLVGTNYYRLTATAADGSNVSSNVIAIGSSDAASVKVFPNPVKNSLQVTGLSATQKTTLSITDLSGAARAAVTVTGSSYSWNVGQLKAGSYVLRVENGGLVVSKMFIKE